MTVPTQVHARSRAGARGARAGRGVRAAQGQAAASRAPADARARWVEARICRRVRRSWSATTSATSAAIPAGTAAACRRTSSRSGASRSAASARGARVPALRGDERAAAASRINAPLPAGEPLEVARPLESIDDDGTRAILTQKVVTGTRARPRPSSPSCTSSFRSASKEANGVARTAKPRQPKARPTVPADAHEIAFSALPENAGLDFAKLTGDFNPIHWVPP